MVFPSLQFAKRLFRHAEATKKSVAYLLYKKLAKLSFQTTSIPLRFYLQYFLADVFYRLFHSLLFELSVLVKLAEGSAVIRRPADEPLFLQFIA